MLVGDGEFSLELLQEILIGDVSLLNVLDPIGEESLRDLRE